MTDFEALTAPMPEEAIEWRVQRTGEKEGRLWMMVVPYGSARWLMDRLDEVLGASGWQTAMKVVDTGMMVERVDPRTGEVKPPEWSPPTVLCGLGIRDLDGEWIWKWDVGSYTDFGDAAKGGATHAFRRACVPWNVGGIRLLYEVDGPVFADIGQGGRIETYLGKKYGKVRWDPPVLFGPEGLLDQTAQGGVQRAPLESRGAAPSSGTGGGGGGGQAASVHVLERKSERGKHSGKTWGQIVLDDRSYVEWAMDGTDWFSDADKAALKQALGEDASGPTDDQMQGGDVSGPPSQDEPPIEAYEDDLPF